MFFGSRHDDLFLNSKSMNNTNQITESADLTSFSATMCTDTLRLAMEPLARTAEAVWNLRAELGMSYEDYERYCEREFGIPAQLLLGLLEYHQHTLSRLQISTLVALGADPHE